MSSLGSVSASRSVRFRRFYCTCIGTDGEEAGCDGSNSAYTIKLGRTSLLKKGLLPDVEFNHQLISYRGFVYEYGCNYGVQILDLNDPDYKYDGITVEFETAGSNSCTYGQVLPFTMSWGRRYSIRKHNCQHFASKLAEYLKTAQCSGSRKRNTEELTAFADNLVFNCTECCEVADTEGTAVQVMAPTVLLLLALIPLLDQ